MIGRRLFTQERARLLVRGGGEPVPERGGVGSSPCHLRCAAWCGGLVAFSGVWWLLGACGAIVATGAGGLFLKLYRGRRRFARLESFENDYPTLLIALASSVRAGLDPLTAMIAAEDLFPKESLLRSELHGFVREIDTGEKEEVAVRNFGRSIDHPDLVLLRNAYLIARREGSSLGECLHRLARVTRQRQSFRRKIRGAVAMQRLSTIGIVACAALIGLFQGVTNPRGVAEAIADPRGIVALSLGGFCMLGGVVWMFYLIRARV